MFWTDFEIRPMAGEKLVRGPERNQLQMVPDPNKLNFWDEGWTSHPDFKQNFPCIIGWDKRPREPGKPKGKLQASSVALQRWKEDFWASGIRFYEDVNMAWSKTKPNECRVISPSETERLLGFPVVWTNPGGHEHGHTVPLAGAEQYKRKNAAMPAYSDPDLMAPYKHDVLDDILPEAASIAESFSDLTYDVDEYIQGKWNSTLVGPDPGAGGRKNRSQRAAALGTQLGGHLSRNGLSLLIRRIITTQQNTWNRQGHCLIHSLHPRRSRWI